MIALLCAVVQGAWADGGWELVYRQTKTTSANWTALNAGSSTGYTIGTAGTTTYYYATGNLSFTNSTVGGSGLTIRGTVYLYIPSGKTVRCTGAKANDAGITGGGAGVELAAGNTLYLLGNGRLEATGGDGESGYRGGHGEDAKFEYNKYCQPGSGGRGGDGGGGGGAGIGTRGGNGGAGGAGGSAIRDEDEGTNKGVAGSPGSNGDTAGSMGTLYVYQGWSLSVIVKGGGAGWFTTAQSERGKNAAEDPYNQYAASGGGGGGTSGNGGRGADIGTGGGGGGGGGGGAAGNSTWRNNASNGFYRVGAGGGKGGGNDDGTYALDGGSSELSNPYDAELNNGLVGTYTDSGWEDDNGAAAGGSGGTCGAACKWGKAVTINVVLDDIFNGKGTESAPYIIGSIADWDVFALLVSNGISFNGLFVKLPQDLSVETMAGSSETNSFQGTFLGNDKTLTFTKGSAQGAFNEEYCAPFRYVKNATIQNLKVAGDIYTAQKFAAGLVARSYGETTFTDCHVTTAIHSSVSGDGTHGGFVALPEGNISFTGCVYTGRLLTTKDTNNCGGFVAFHNSKTFNFTHSLYAPDTTAPADGETTITAGCATFVRGGSPANGSTCYYTETMGTEQGSKVIVLASAPSNFGSMVQDYGTVKVYDNGLLVAGRYYVACDIAGTDTEGDPITISSSEEWNTFVSNVNGGNSYSGKFVKLTNDISVTEMAGSSETNSFQGTFLGNDKTLTFTKGSSESAFGEENCAPFRYTKDATIRDLKVAGDIYTSQKYAAGLVASNAGKTTITNCRVSTVIHSSVSGDGTHGGIVAMPASGATTDITGCVYNGRLLTTNGTTYCGGFVGWSGTTTVTVTNSLYAPNTALPASGSETAIDNGATFVRGNSNMTINANCYYTEAMGSTQGVQVYATIPGGEIYKPVTVANTTVYLCCTVSNVAEYYMYTGSEIAVVPTVTWNGTTLTAGTDYSVSFSPNTVQALGQYTMTITGSTDEYKGSKNISFKVVGPLSGTGESSTDPYLIQNAGDWWYFANTVNNGTDNYSGKFVKLTHDISVTQKVGTVSGSTQVNAFSGTFDGGGNTITANITDNDNQGTALFCYINGATIKDLNVTGTIASNQYHTAGLVGFSKGTGNSIQNCTVSANVSGKGYVGGIVGHSTDSNISICDCVYSGLMTGGGNCTRVFIGWGDSGTRSVTDCLYIMADGQSTSNFDLVKEGGTLTMNRLYKTTSAGSQGTLVSSTAPVDGVYQSITAANNKTYYIILIVSNVKEYYRYTGSAIAIEPSVTAGSINGPALTEGTDYTCTLSHAPVQDVGSYTLTFTGIGSYKGTKTCNIRVLGSDEYYPINSEMTTLASEKYGVFQDLEITSRIKISGDVTLFLGEGTTLHAPKGIELSAGNSLTIEGPGALTIDNCDQEKSGIGAQNVGTLTINGGTINVQGGQSGAGIGGSFQNFEGGNIFINGGVVNATGGYRAAGIGGGHYSLTAYSNRGYCCNITINGGQVTAIGGSGAYGIGPGVNGESNYGSLKIGWTKLSDFFNSTFNLDHVSFADGKIFLFDGTKTLATINAISGKKIVPFVLSTLSGHGTEGDPYLISNDDQWITFAYNVNNGTSYNGEFVKLGADISASTMVGTSDNKFKGTFLGDGDYTLTFTRGTAQSAFGEQYCAPFRYTDGATIQNLKVEGYIYTSQKYAAGLVARNAGTTTITNCRVSTVIHSSAGGDGTHGGFIALPEGNVTFSNCVYDGRMFTSSGTDLCGGFIGWGDNKTFNITNSLYAPNPNITPADNEVAIATSCATFVRGGSPAEGSTCYYTEAMGTAQGTQVYATIPENEICKAATICNTAVYIMPVCTVSGIEESYSLNNGVEITPVVKYNETSLAFGTDYTATLDGQTVASFPVSPNKMGTYTLILTGAGDYAGEKSFYITLMPSSTEAVTLTDAGTYSFKADVNVVSATYKKSLGESRVGKYQAWFVPFDYTITDDDLVKFDFYKINMIANAPNSQTNATDDIWVFLKKMSADEVLRANMPYVYKPKQVVEDYDFTTANATLKAKNTGVLATMQTMEDTYTLYGTYDGTTATAGDPFYYVNIDGDLSLGNDGSVTVGAYRWIMRVESKLGSTAYARTAHFLDGEGSEASGIKAIDNGQLTIDNVVYDLQGRRVAQPTKSGLYIVNGRKVIIK